MKINKFLKKNLFLIIILLLAAFLRLYQLDRIPNSLTPDEASLGYNAYSILKTGRDEYGQRWPMIFKSFGDYKPGLYVYLTVPFVALLDLNELAVRLPGAISGILAVYLIYILVAELFIGQVNAKRLSLLSAVVLAFNPWHLFFSRGAWEANVSLTLTLTGIYFFLKALKRPKLIIITFIFFALTIVTYQGSKLATVIAAGILFLVYLKTAVKINIKYYLFSIILSLLITAPIIASLFSGKTGRLEVYSLFSYARSNEYIQTILNQNNERTGDLNYYLYHSESLNLLRGLMGRWFNHYSGRFLFFEGNWQNAYLGIPHHGWLYLFDAFFLMLGLGFVMKKKSPQSLFIIIWLVLASMPAVLTKDQIQPIRALNMLVPLVIIIACGLNEFITFIESKKKLLKTISYLSLITGYVFCFVYFLDAYFIHLNQIGSKNWYFGYREVVHEVSRVQNLYPKIIFQQSYAQPYIYFLFYQKYDPMKYQKQAVLLENTTGDVGLVDKLDNVTFRSVGWPFGDPGDLLVGNGYTIPDYYPKNKFRLISEIYYPNKSEVAFRLLYFK